MQRAGQFCFTHPSGKDIYLYSLHNENGSEVRITNYGATLMAYKIMMPDKTLNDIVLGFDTVAEYLNADYLKANPFMGAAIGRYANRIKKASFSIDDREIHVTKNWGEHQLHGGLDGFDKKVWEFDSLDEACNILRLKYYSPDGEEGYPGNLEVTVCFELNDDDDLIYTYTAHCDKPTAVNLTHHSYFNLNNGQGTIENHELKIFSDKILEQDADLVTTGNYIAVDNTKYDFREFRSLDQGHGGYDQSFVIDKKPDELTVVAEAYSNDSGLSLKVLTTEPLVHLYTGQGLPKIKGKNNTVYAPYSGFCLETQKHPNAINIPKFPNTVLRPGVEYHQKNIYKVSFSGEK